MKVGSRNSEDVTNSTVRQQSIRMAKLDGVDYGDSKAVQKAREAITYMGVREIIVDTFEGGRNREALERLADVLLCEKAASWQKDGSDRVLCEEIAKLDRREAQGSFLEMLSPERRQAILATPQETEEGIQFSPDTKTELDNLLTITFTLEEGKKLLQSGDVAEAWLTARGHELKAAKSREEAEALRSNGSHPLAAKAWKQAAEHFSASGKSVEAAEAYEQAASDFTADGPDRTNDCQRLAAADALHAAAEHWHDAGRHHSAATSRHRQAEYLTKLGMHDEAAHCTEMERLQRDLHDRNSAATRLPADLLREIASRLPNSASLRAFSLTNSSWHSAVTPGQNAARTVAKVASDQVVDAGVGNLDIALAAIKDLPTCLQLEPLLQLANKTIINNSPNRASAADEKLDVFRAIDRAAAELEPGDRRTLLTKLSACVPYVAPDQRSNAWLHCFESIRDINAAEPRDMGASVVQLATSFPRDFMREDNAVLEDLRLMIDGLRDGDPHKRQAQNILSKKLVTVHSWL